MKKIISILLLVSTLCLCFVSCGKSDYEKAMELIAEGKYESAYTALKKLENDERAEAELKKFRFVPISLKHTDGNFEKLATLSYSEEKNLFQIIIDTSVIDCSYSDDGKLIQVVRTAPDGGKAIEDYTYSDNGILNEVAYTAIDGEITVESYLYNDDGTLLSITYTEESGVSTAATYSYVYALDGNLIKKIITNTDGSKTIYDYSYDSNGNLIKAKHTTPSGYTSCIEYTYGDNNVLSYGTYHASDGRKFNVAISYDEYGNLIKKSYIDQDGNTTSIEATLKLLYFPTSSPTIIEKVIDYAKGQLNKTYPSHTYSETQTPSGNIDPDGWIEVD